MKKLTGLVLTLAVLSSSLVSAAGGFGAMDPIRVSAVGLSDGKGTQTTVGPTNARTGTDPTSIGPAPNAGDGIDNGSGLDEPFGSDALP